MIFQSIWCIESPVFLLGYSCRDGKEFSPIVGFFIDAGPSEV